MRLWGVCHQIDWEPAGGMGLSVCVCVGGGGVGERVTFGINRCITLELLLMTGIFEAAYDEKQSNFH